MHFKRKINYYMIIQIVILFKHRNVQLLWAFQYFRTNSSHDREKIVPSPAIPLDQ